MTDETQTRRGQVAADLEGCGRENGPLRSSRRRRRTGVRACRARGERWWFLPASILFGGALGLLNFRWLAIAVERVYLRKGATAIVSSMAAAVIGILKLALIFIILFVVMKWQLVHIFGLVGGLSLCFLAILWEGATLMKQTLTSTE